MKLHNYTVQLNLLRTNQALKDLGQLKHETESVKKISSISTITASFLSSYMVSCFFPYHKIG